MHGENLSLFNLRSIQLQMSGLIWIKTFVRIKFLFLLIPHMFGIPTKAFELKGEGKMRKKKIKKNNSIKGRCDTWRVATSPLYEKFFIPAGFTTQAIKWLKICRSGEKSLTPPFIFCSYIFIFFPVSSTLYIDISIYTHISRPPLIRAIPDGCARKEEQILRIWRGCRGSWFLLSTAHQTPRLSRGFPPFFLRPSGLFPRILFK